MHNEVGTCAEILPAKFPSIQSLLKFSLKIIPFTPHWLNLPFQTQCLLMECFEATVFLSIVPLHYMQIPINRVHVQIFQNKPLFS